MKNAKPFDARTISTRERVCCCWFEQSRDFFVFVGEEQVVCVDGAVLTAIEVCPVVDVFAAMKSSTLSRHGLALLPPFTVSTAMPRSEPKSRPKANGVSARVPTQRQRCRLCPRSTKASFIELCRKERHPLPEAAKLILGALPRLRDQSLFRDCDGITRWMAAEELGQL